MSILDSQTLKVNSQWQPFEIISVRQCFSDMAAGAGAAIYFDQGWPSLKDLEEWLTLPEPLEKQDSIGLPGEYHEIKRLPVPRVMLTLNYGELRTKEQQLTLENLARWYKHICQLSGRKLTPEEWSREHIDPRSLGGKMDWENITLAGKEENSERGNKPYEETRFERPVSKGAPPPLLPINTLINRHGYEEWDLFHVPRL